MAVDDLDKLVERFLDDRDGLSESQVAELVVALEESPELASEVKNQLMVDELLAQRLTIDRQNFMAQVEQRVADHLEGEEALDAQVSELHTLASYQYDEWLKENKTAGSRKAWWGAAVAVGLLLVAAGAAVGYLATQNWGRVAVLEQARGGVSFIRGGETEPALTRDAIRPGDRLRTLQDGFARVRYSDGTLVEITPGSLVEFASDRATGGKRVFIERGGIVADVASQPSPRPMVFGSLAVEATVRGTRLMLDVDGERARLDVIEGSVDVVRASDQAKTTVAGRQFLVASAQEKLEVESISWPTNDDRLELEFGSVESASRRFELQPRGRARFNHDFALELSGGAYVAPRQVADRLLLACRSSNQFTVEAVVRPNRLKQNGPARIIAFSTDSFDYNLQLCQEGSWLVLRLATTPTGSNKVDRRELKLLQLKDTNPHHVVFSYGQGQSVCYFDGRAVEFTGSDALHGDFRHWSRSPLLFGDDWNGDRDWQGALDAVAIYSREMPAIEARRNAAFYLSEIAARSPVPQIEVEATLLARSMSPSAAEIAPQRSLLVMSQYRIDKVHRGRLEDEKVLIMQWAILNSDPQPIVDAKPGEKFSLLLEHAQHNPQLGTSRCANDFDMAGQSAVYYDVR